MVTIIGGGIAGSALAGALARRGDRVALYEQQPTGGGGAFLFIDGRGHDAMTALGVAESDLHAVSYPVAGLRYVNSVGRRGEMNGRGHRFWLRRNLMQVLDDFVAGSGVETHYTTPITDISLGADSCTLHHDGATTSADGLIVGCDGIDSVVRSRLDPDRTPVYAGDVVLYGTTRDPLELPTEPSALHFFAEIGADGIPGSTVGHIWRPGDLAYWFIRLPRDALEGTDDLGLRPVGEWAQAVRDASPSNADLVGTLLDHTDAVHVSNARNVPLDTAQPPALPVVLVGDADHAITPAAGVGARDALEDVHAVFDALVTGESPARAMAERRRRIGAERDQVQRRRAG
ncbi:FAD-dependent oxidoreductase [Nocardia wallacei]|uniref:FAD-dependent oxidoreductase n=1 Tax=Nocardia wallacei TaxID=480035 RepID=UPI0024568473|nr:FAD-dependent oxidoreductase [Nocardia wallacei]